MLRSAALLLPLTGLLTAPAFAQPAPAMPPRIAPAPVAPTQVAPRPVGLPAAPTPIAPPAAAPQAAANPQAPPIPAPSMQCRQAIAQVERMTGIPTHLLAAIARVESGRSDGKGNVHPWPWTINVEGAGYTYESKAEAIAAVRSFQAKGARSIDVGCMQVNLMYHPTAFASLEEAFDPLPNARYAAKFLTDLRTQAAGDWVKATANYHSATPALGEAYQKRVAAVMPDESRRQMASAGQPAAAGNVWTQNVWSQNVWNARGTAWPNESGVPRQPPLPPTVGYQLSNRADTARTLPAAPGTVGRGLEAYRAAPIAATRPPARL